MERENEEYKLRAVTPTQYRVLAAAGDFDVKQACLTREMADGRLEIVMRRKDIERLEELEREVIAECDDVGDNPAPLELPELPIVPLAPAEPAMNIPDIDKAAYKRLMPDQIPERPESSRPRDGIGGSGGLINFDGLFNR
jgi:hypothetical protein